MKKKLKDEEDKKETKQESSETTGTESTLNLGKTTGTDKVAEVKKLDKLSLEFPNEDLNKLVAKINEVIDKQND